MKVEFIATLAALALGASAQTTVPPAVQQSVLMVLATALPSDSISLAVSSPSVFASQVASSLGAGHTPAWYASLPADVKTLLPVIYKVQATPTPSSSSASSSAAARITKSATPTMTSHATSASVTSQTASYSSVLSTTTSSSSKTASASPAATSNAAAVPRAAVGAGIGAAMGFVGMLAL